MSQAPVLDKTLNVSPDDFVTNPELHETLTVLAHVPVEFLSGLVTCAVLSASPSSAVVLLQYTEHRILKTSTNNSYSDTSWPN